MRLLRDAFCLLAVISAASFALGVDTAFAGTWKLNLSKSQLVLGTVNFAPDGDGIRITRGGESYVFKPDGSTNKTRFGSASWKKIDDHTWEETDMVKARLDTKATWAVSADGKTLTERITGDGPAGRLEDTSTFVRVGGSNGLAGSWKDREYRGNSPSLLVLSDADNGLIFDEPDFKLKAMATFDGKPGTVEGPNIPPGASLVLSRLGRHSFKMTRTQNGKPPDVSTWTVSSDGKVLKSISRTAGTNDPPTTEVFEKQ